MFKKLIAGFVLASAMLTVQAGEWDTSSYTRVAPLLDDMQAFYDNTNERRTTGPSITTKLFNAVILYSTNGEPEKYTELSPEKQAEFEQQVLETLKSWLKGKDKYSLPSWIRGKEAEQIGLMIEKHKEDIKAKLLKDTVKEQAIKDGLLDAQGNPIKKVASSPAEGSK